MDVVDRLWLSAHTVQCSWGNVWRLDDARWLTDLSWRDVVGSQLSGSTQRRLCFDGEAVVVQTWRLLSINDCKRDVADTVVVSQEMPRSATPYTSLNICRPQSNSDWLRGGVKIVNLSHSGDHWLSPVQNISFSRFVLSGRLGWRHGLIWPLIGWPYL